MNVTRNWLRVGRRGFGWAPEGAEFLFTHGRKSFTVLGITFYTQDLSAI